MIRFLQTAAVLVAVLVGGAALALYLSYGQHRLPRRAAVPGLAADASVAWYPRAGQPPVITAATEADALRAVGFAQTQDHLWTMLLWRQAGRGALGEWFGEALFPADRLARTLGLERGAVEAFDALPEADRLRLRAFAEGVNAGMRTKRARRGALVTLREVPFEPWRPHDALVVERLAAWIGTDAFGESAPNPAVRGAVSRSAALAAFARADRLMRDVLCADGYGETRLWATRDTSGARFVAQFVTGSSALPAFAEADVRVGNGVPVTFAFVPGTPFPAAGRGGAAWAVRLTSAASLAPSSAERVPRRSERIRARDGREAAFSVASDAGGVYFEADRRPPPRPAVRAVRPRRAAVRPDTLRTAPPAPSGSSARRAAVVDSTRLAPDSARADTFRARPERPPPPRFRLAWAGLGATSDASAWLALWAGGTPGAFRLFAGEGVRLGAGGVPAAFGAATGATRALANGVLVAPAAWADALGARLAALPVAAQPGDARSVWAARLAGPMAARVDSSRLRRRIEAEALAYARNWVADFEGASIGATIFEAWTAEEARAGRPLAALAADTSFFSGLRRTETFRRAVRAVERRLGPDVRQWRWERARPDVRWFPVWSVAARLRLGRPASAQYAPLPLPGGGHPSSLRYGPAQASEPFTAVYEFDVRTRESPATRPSLTLHRFLLNTERFLDRYRIQDVPFEPVDADARAAPLRVTRLTPA